MTKQDDTMKQKKFTWPRILLFVSLALNLLIIGIVVGAIVRFDKHGGDDNARRGLQLRELGYGPYGQALSPKHRRELADTLKSHEGSLTQNRSEMREHFGSLLSALRASPFDIKAVGDIIATQQSRLSERQELGKTLLLQQIATMSDEERGEFADRLAKRLRKVRRR